MATRFIDTEKFKGVVLSIEKHVVKQNGILQTIADDQKLRMNTEKEAEETRKRREVVEKSKRDKKNRPEKEKDLIDKIKNMFGMIGKNTPSFGNMLNIGALALASPFIYQFAKGFIGEIFTSLSASLEDGTIWNGLGELFSSEFGTLVLGSAIFGPKRMLLGTFLATGLLNGLESGLNSLGFDVNIDEAVIAPIISLIGNTLLSIAGSKVMRKLLGGALTKLFRGGKAVLNLGRPRATTPNLPKNLETPSVESAKPRSTFSRIREMFSGKRGAAETVISTIDDPAVQAVERVTERSAVSVFGKSFGTRLGGALSTGLELLSNPFVQLGAYTVADAFENADESVKMIRGDTSLTDIATPEEWRLYASGGLDQRRTAEIDSALYELKDTIADKLQNSGWQPGSVMYEGELESLKLIDSLLARSANIESLISTMPTTAAPTDQTRATPSTGIFYGDSNRIINSMMKTFTSDSEGFALSPSAVLSKLDAMKPTAAKTSGAGSIIAGSGNTTVTKGGDSVVTNVTNIYGTTPSSSLDKGNSVPQVQYGVQ